MSSHEADGPLAATFLDLPAGSPGGRVELFLDLYTGDHPLIPARAFMLGRSSTRHLMPAGLDLLPPNPARDCSVRRRHRGATEAMSTTSSSSPRSSTAGRSPTCPGESPTTCPPDPPARPARISSSHLRLRYAGRLAAEKGVEALVKSLAPVPAVELSIAAPRAQSPRILKILDGVSQCSGAGEDAPASPLQLPPPPMRWDTRFATGPRIASHAPAPAEATGASPNSAWVKPVRPLEIVRKGDHDRQEISRNLIPSQRSRLRRAWLATHFVKSRPGR